MTSMILQNFRASKLMGLLKKEGQDNWRSTFNMGILLNYPMKFFTLRD